MIHAHFFIFILALILTSCTPPNSHVTSCESQLAIRQIQTREFENVTINQVMRASIATLQDLDFILEKVDANIGTITASKFRNNVCVKMTVTVREKGANLAVVRASATYGERAVEDPICYQDFLALLDKSLFLVKNKVD